MERKVNKKRTDKRDSRYSRYLSFITEHTKTKVWARAGKLNPKKRGSESTSVLKKLVTLKNSGACREG